MSRRRVDAVSADPRTEAALSTSSAQGLSTVFCHESDIHACAGGCPILRPRFLMRWGLPPIFLKNADAGAASATQRTSRSNFIIVRSPDKPK